MSAEDGSPPPGFEVGPARQFDKLFGSSFRWGYMGKVDGCTSICTGAMTRDQAVELAWAAYRRMKNGK